MEPAAVAALIEDSANRQAEELRNELQAAVTELAERTGESVTAATDAIRSELTLCQERMNQAELTSSNHSETLAEIQTTLAELRAMITNLTPTLTPEPEPQPEPQPEPAPILVPVPADVVEPEKKSNGTRAFRLF